MAVISADTVQLAYAEETNGTPATTFQLIRTTGESLTFAPNTSEDTEIGTSGRSSNPATVVGMSISGDINFDLSPQPFIYDVIAGVFANDWGNCPETGTAILAGDENVIGQDIKRYTVEKRFPNPASPGNYFFHAYKGVTFSSFTITVTPNEIITGSVTMVGGDPEIYAAATSKYATVGYADAGNDPKFRAPDVADLQIGGLGMNSHCFSSLTITVDSANEGIACIGSLGDREVALGTATVTVSGDVFFADQTILESMLKDETVGDGHVVFANTATTPDILRFDFFGLKPTGGSLNAGGRGERLTIPIELQPTPDIVCGDWKSSVRVSQTNTPFVAP
jgi:hypothetical protein